HLLPHHATLAQYRALFARLDIARSLVNSTIVAVGSTLLSLVINGLAGYAFAKLRFRGRDRTFRLLLIALVVPAQVGMLPMFLELRAIGLVNTLPGVMLPFISGVFGIFM